MSARIEAAYAAEQTNEFIGRCMTKGQLAFGLVLALSVIGVLADSVLKHASSQRNVVFSKWFFLGLLLSFTFAIGWLFLMRFMKLATAGVLYGVLSALLLCFIGVVFFNERLSSTEIAGVAAATLAIILLGSVAE